jgi:hypothetical protein
MAGAPGMMGEMKAVQEMVDSVPASGWPNLMAD